MSALDLVMQRQVPARASTGLGDSVAAETKGGARNAAFSAILSGEQRSAVGNRGRLDSNDGSDPEPDAEAIDSEDYAADSQSLFASSGSDEMLTLLSGLMSSAAFGEEPAKLVSAETLPDATMAAESGIDEAASGVLAATQMMKPAAPAVTGAEAEEPDVKQGPQGQAEPDTVEVGQPKSKPRANTASPAVALTAAAAAPALTAATAAPALTIGAGQGGQPSAKTSSSDTAPDKQKKTAVSPEVLGALGLSRDASPAGTAEGRTSETKTSGDEGLSGASGRKSASVDRQPDEQIETKPRTVEVVESRRFMPATQVSGNAQLLTSTLIDASNAAVAAQRAAPAGAAAAAALAPTGQTLHTLKLQLNPLSLGNVTAILKLSGEELSVQIKVETAEAYRQLSDDSQSILKSLRGQGYGVEQITIQHVPTSDRAANQSAPTGYQGSFQGSESGDAQSSGQDGSRNRTGQQNPQGRDGHDHNSNVGSGTGRTDGVYL